MMDAVALRMLTEYLKSVFAPPAVRTQMLRTQDQVGAIGESAVCDDWPAEVLQASLCALEHILPRHWLPD